ncbi:hypothetical protein LXL04_017299 [Taraxacum kok-saghyz]
MDVYMVLKETGISKYVMYLCYVLCIIQNIVLYLFRFTGIFESVDQAHHHDHQKQSEGPLLSAVLTRQYLKVTNFKDIRMKDLPESCAVWLEEFGRDDKARCLKNCIHIFHQSCLDLWMDHVHGTCPICRTPILPHAYQDEYKRRLKAAGYGLTPIPALCVPPRMPHGTTSNMQVVGGGVPGCHHSHNAKWSECRRDDTLTTPSCGGRCSLWMTASCWWPRQYGVVERATHTG